MLNRISRLPLLLAIAGHIAAQDAPPLGGPAVAPESIAPTLIDRDYEGRLRPLERRPEVAALDLLGLTDNELADAREVVAERAALVEKLVFDNLLVLGEVGTALAAAPPEAGLEAVDPELRTRFEDALGELWKGTPLADRIESALPEASRRSYRAVVDSWYAAAMEQARERSAGAGVSAYELVIRDVIGREVESAFERGQAGRDETYEEFLAALDLDPETEGRVRKVALDAYLRILNDTGKPPTQAGDAQIFREILTVIPEADHPRVWRAIFRMGIENPE